MSGFVRGIRFRAAIGLIAAYTIALQTLFAAFAPLPANAQASDIAGWHVLCFGSGNAGPADPGDPDAPAPAAGKFHCVLCGPALAAAAVLPDPVAEPALLYSASVVVFAPAPDDAPVRHAIRSGSIRAPPLTI
jgi:hypothetical protein